MAGGSDGSDVPPDARPAFPDVVTHYYRAARPPFLNLSDLDGDHLREVVLTLERERVAGLSARVFGPRYMELRRRTEDKLRSLFADAGGRPNDGLRTTSSSAPPPGTRDWRPTCGRSSWI